MAMKYLLSGSPFRDCAAEPDELLTTYSLDCRIVIKNSTPSLRTLCRHNRGGGAVSFHCLITQTTPQGILGPLRRRVTHIE